MTVSSIYYLSTKLLQPIVVVIDIERSHRIWMKLDILYIFITNNEMNLKYFLQSNRISSCCWCWYFNKHI
ncbi:hypothetical protein WN943_024640 [Citrus x changshan-huyou]